MDLSKTSRCLKKGKEDKFLGVAFVDMVNIQQAKKAISELNGATHFGRTLKVQLADRQNFKPEKKAKPEKEKKVKEKPAKRKKSPRGLDLLFSNLKKL